MKSHVEFDDEWEETEYLSRHREQTKLRALLKAGREYYEGQNSEIRGILADYNISLRRRCRPSGRDLPRRPDQELLDIAGVEVKGLVVLTWWGQVRRHKLFLLTPDWRITNWLIKSPASIPAPASAT